MVNFIKQRPLKSRIFAKLCKSMQKDHVTLFQHTQDRRLSRGKVLSRVLELREELQLFFKDNNRIFLTFLKIQKWLLKLVYLADIYQYLRTLNTSMQGSKENILTFTDKLPALKNKTQVWKKHLLCGNIEMLPLLLQIQDQSDYKEVISLITSHLESLTDSLSQCFPSMSSEMYDWVRKPFAEFSQNSLSMQEEEKLTELQCDRTLKMKFTEVPIDVFWISTIKEYPLISAKAEKILLQFSTS
jgi:hypothetical protein